MPRPALPAPIHGKAPKEPTKAELVAQAEARGLPTSGTKADLIARLEATDE